jgi:hypothetical protein
VEGELMKAKKRTRENVESRILTAVETLSSDSTKDLK